MSEKPNNTDESLLSALFDGLKDFLNRPLPGTTPHNTQPAPSVQIEEGALLDKLKEIFNTQLLGTKDSNEIPKPNDSLRPQESIHHHETPQNQIRVAQNWDELRAQHEQERNSLIDRHNQEWEVLKKRHGQEREALKEKRKT